MTQAGRIGHGSSLLHADDAAGAILHLARQLTTSGVDIVAAGFAHRGDQARIEQHLGKRRDPRRGRSLEPGLGKRVERNQIELAVDLRSPHQPHQILSQCRGVVHTVEHAIFEGDEVARGKVEIALARRQQFVQRVLAIERHQFVA